MKGGTTFHFVTDGIESALRQAREAADGADVRIGGGAQVVSIPVRARGLAADTIITRSSRCGSSRPRPVCAAANDLTFAGGMSI